LLTLAYMSSHYNQHYIAIPLFMVAGYNFIQTFRYKGELINKQRRLESRLKK